LLEQLRDTCAAEFGDEGQALVEYALVLLLIALVAVPMLTAIGVDVTGPFSDVSNAL
jgi:Flp pilus assembly pilin Flp